MLLALSLATNAWLAFRLHHARQIIPEQPEAPVSGSTAAMANPAAGFTLMAWDYKITTMQTDQGATVAAKFIEGHARNDSKTEAGKVMIYFSLYDKAGAKVSETSAAVDRIRTNEVWKFKTELFKYPLTAKFSRFVIP